MSPKPLPERPRVRASYWYEGTQLKLELTLMDEQRERVHRETIAVAPDGALAKIFSVFASLAANRAVEAGFATADAALTPTVPPPSAIVREPVVELTREELATARAERAERAGLVAAALPEVAQELWSEPEAESEPEAVEQQLSSEERAAVRADRAERAAETEAAERRRRAAETVVDNSQPKPEEAT